MEDRILRILLKLNYHKAKRIDALPVHAGPTCTWPRMAEIENCTGISTQIATVHAHLQTGHGRARVLTVRLFRANCLTSCCPLMGVYSLHHFSPLNCNKKDTKLAG